MGKKTSMDEKDAVAILELAAKDMKVKTDDFVHLFRRISRAPRHIGGFERLQASMETYAILLQGLLYRKELQRALQFCHFLFENSGLPLNKEVVTLGARILTQSGRVGSAIDLLESVTPKPLSNSALGPTSMPIAPPVPNTAPDTPISLLEPVSLDATTMNVWMHSLRRIGRPDAVLTLWDDMYTLYGIVHTNATLNIMLETARKLALRNEQSIRRQFAKYFSFRRKGETSTEGFELKEVDSAIRAKAQERLQVVVGGHKAKGGDKWTAGLWRGDQPEETARKVFLQIMFGMDLARNLNGFHSPTPIGAIRAPARSVRRNWDAGGGVVGLGVALPSLKMERCQFDVGKEMYRWVPAPGSPPDSKNLVPRPHYPHLSLDDSNFFDYLCLLSVTQRTTEVALTMAWMRHLRIYPSQATLALAMVLWGEISVEAPIVQGLSNFGRSGEEGSEGNSRPMDEYERFVQWLGGWVGKKKIPEDHVLRNFRVVVKNIRNSESAPKMTKKAPKRQR
ncbi:hypothetical protein BKA70DRAFT_1266484 [Coprinopsis sp. MPI-PUGE-AT-0042]|nr:hypothetical protein BKA70DRAFT_1266484 [Coprinopsis sp. MPI-PUGE-AT-0042]